MTFVIRHIPTGVFIGSDGDHIISDDALKFRTISEAKQYIPMLVNPASEFEVLPSDPTRRNHINLVSDNHDPSNKEHK